jgi:hypothetical protein
MSAKHEDPLRPPHDAKSAPRATRRAQRLNIGPLIEQAEKSGKRVLSVTVTLTFGEPESTSAEVETSEQLRKII